MKTTPYPPVFRYKNCILCDAPATGDFCDDCLTHLPGPPASHCSVCLNALPLTALQHESPVRCGTCVSNPPAYDATVAALAYTFPIDALIHALKYRAQLAIAPILAKRLTDRLKYLQRDDTPDLIVPMPLHPERLRERGFNQALEIARGVARTLEIRLVADGCARIRNTPPQAELPWKLRQQNVRRAFDCTLDLTGMHVAVVDDVMTTGATLHALALRLKRQGAAKISNWLAARVQIEQLQRQPRFDF